MALYLVEHRHTAETCPTRNRDMMFMLGKHVSQETADTFGIKIHADVVHRGEHRMMMVLETENPAKVDEYMQPFKMVGSVDVKEVATCEEVVRTETC
jgi:hypothetical protein